MKPGLRDPIGLLRRRGGSGSRGDAPIILGELDLHAVVGDQAYLIRVDLVAVRAVAGAPLAVGAVVVQVEVHLRTPPGPAGDPQHGQQVSVGGVRQRVR